MIDQVPLWRAYAEQTPHTPGPAPVKQRMEWGTWEGTGPDARILGPALSTRRVLELGCGAGHNAAHLAAVHSVDVTAIDQIDVQIHRAVDNYGAVNRLTFLVSDALRYLRCGTAPFDTVYSVFGAIGVTQPGQILPAIARRLRPHGRLIFSVPHPRRHGQSASSGVFPRWDQLRLPDGTRRPIPRWDLDAAGWISVLHRSGFYRSNVQELSDPRYVRPTALLISSRKR
ncbi:class I SAM-dependent methyltransferase [Streptomyces termitum]|uniref:class I SAM-dependent methyltransferase n=1 Tax=Streptomyces termitum TaxID=67368 RepID=UPI00379E5900